ncbi:MAG: glycosyltransferase [Tepidisphaeraceae bacterium]
MALDKSLNIGITCYPSVGGSGILASALGEELARRGHEVHFIGYERPFRLPDDAPRLHFHAVEINDYGLFKYPDYTLPLSVRMAEVSRDHKLDILHVHYAVPHATAAILARSMLEGGAPFANPPLPFSRDPKGSAFSGSSTIPDSHLPPHRQPRIVTTLHGTDTLLLGRDPGYGPAIRHALNHSDAITTVSAYLKDQTQRLLDIDRPIDVIHNFFAPRPTRRSRRQMRAELGLHDEAMILHASNLRPLKRIDLLLETAARIRPRESFKLVILAGEPFAPFAGEVRRLGLENRVIVREKVNDIEDYLQAADLGLFTSEMESFCLSILEAMSFACPSVATRVGGIPEVVQDNISGILVPPGDADALARMVELLIQDPARRAAMGRAAQTRARDQFSAEVIVPRYEALYHRVRG